MKKVDKEISRMERRIKVHYTIKYGSIMLIALVMSILYYLYMAYPVLEVDAQVKDYNMAVVPKIIPERQLLLENETALEPSGNANIMNISKTSETDSDTKYIPTVQPISNNFDEPIDLYVQCLKLNVRSGCGESYPIIDTITYGTSVKGIGYVLNDSGDKWVKIGSDEGVKYVKSDYVSEDSPVKYIGDFYITYYCGCEICCDIAGRPTASGKMPESGRTVAADKFLPFGTKLLIDNKIYVVEDRGGAIKGNRIDIYCDTHKGALSHRTKTIPIWMVISDEDVVKYY